MAPTRTLLAAFFAGALAAIVTAEPVPHTIEEDAPSCTSTTVVKAHDEPVPPSTYEPTWTITKYTTTATAHTGVDCGGCAHLESNIAYINYLYPDGPSPPSITTVTATEAQTITEAHCTGAVSGAKPDATPAVMGARMNADDESAAKACTKFIPHAEPFTHGLVKTVWTSTTTVTQSLDCGACKTVLPHLIPFGPGPVIFFSTTVTATGPSTTYVPACGTGKDLTKALERHEMDAIMTSRPHYYQAPPFTVQTAVPEGAKATCTSQFALDPEVPNSTFTVYGSTVTSTTSIDCKGCAVQWSTAVLNFFAPIQLTATVTADGPSTSRAVACAEPTA